MVESSIGPYRILERLGSGGMGDVYLAEDTRLHRKVALKALAEAWSKAADARQRLLREARAAAQLNHPNIAAIYDVIETPDSAYIVMEHVQGEPLARRLAHGPLPPEQVADIALQLCDAMAAAHAHGVIHRDLKPGNVLLTHDGKVKVLDFGLAKAPPGQDAAVAASDPTLEVDGHLLGTPAYMAPEQLRRQTMDQRTDLYSLGVMLFELLTGRRPFKGEGVMQLALAILHDPTPSPAQADPTVPPGLSAIVSRAMAREPAERFQSAVEMREALRRLPLAVTDAPTLSAAFPWGSTTRRGFARPGARRVAWALGVAATAVGGLLWYRWIGGRDSWAPDKPPVVAVLPLANVGGRPADDYIGVGIADTLVTHLAGVPGLTVVSRSATQEYQGRLPNTGRLARDLGLSYVVSGAVQRVDHRLRVTLNLVRPDDSVVWGQDYEGGLDELFDLQRQVAEGLATALRPDLAPALRGGAARPPTQDREAFAEYARARALLERPDVPGNVAKAIAACQRAIERDAKFALAHAGLGEAYWARYRETQDVSDTLRARDAALEALRLDPDHAATRYVLAVIYDGTGRSEAASEELHRVLALQPRNDDAHRLLGNILAEQGRWEEALVELRGAVELRPLYWRNLAAVGHLFYRTGRYPEAIAAFRKVTELQPDNSRGFQMLGTAYQAAGEEDRALENYRKAVERGPDARAYSNIGLILYGQGKFAEAARVWEQAAQLEPGSPLRHRNLGDAYARLLRQADARQAYERAVALAQQSLEINPKDAASLAMLAVCEAKLGRRAEAARHVAKAVALGRNDADTLYEQAIVHALSGQADLALSALEEALKRGYSASLARRDDDLEALRGLPGFQSLLGSPQTR